MSDIPTDLWREILLRVKFEDLLRLRSVSLSFRHLIDSPSFRAQHFSRPNPSPHKIILSSRYSCYSLSFDSINPSITPDYVDIEVPVAKFNHPVSPGHGIRCSNHSNNSFMLLLDVDKTQVFFWNPASGQHQSLPVGHLIRHGSVSENYGMGLDHSSSLFKVVVITHRRLAANPDVFMSTLRPKRNHQLRPSYWKPMEQLPYEIYDKKCFGVFVGGALHWLVRVGDSNAVLAIDLGTEKYSVMSLPQREDGRIVKIELNVIGGCLCVCWFSPTGQKFEGWIMKEYGKVDSWSNLYTLQPSDVDIPILWRLFRRPVAYSNCGTQLLVELDNGLAWYHLQNKSFKNLRLSGSGTIGSFKATTYAGGFVMNPNPLEIDIPSTMQRKRKSQIVSL